VVETAHPAQALNCLFYFLQPKDVLPVTFVYKRQQNILLESVLKLNLNKRAFNARNENRHTLAFGNRLHPRGYNVDLLMSCPIILC
jgi:hypothetical protein